MKEPSLARKRFWNEELARRLRINNANYTHCFLFRKISQSTGHHTRRYILRLFLHKHHCFGIQSIDSHPKIKCGDTLKSHDYIITIITFYKHSFSFVEVAIAGGYRKWPTCNKRLGASISFKESKKGRSIDRKRLKDRGVYSQNYKKHSRSNKLLEKISRELKIAEYPLHQLLRLGRQEIHIALSQSQHRCQNSRSGIMCCHRQSILTLNLTLNNKTKYTKPC